MKAPLFEYPSYQYQIDDWEFKKKGLLRRIEEKFVRTELQTLRPIGRQMEVISTLLARSYQTSVV